MKPLLHYGRILSDDLMLAAPVIAIAWFGGHVLAWWVS